MDAHRLLRQRVSKLQRHGEPSIAGIDRHHEVWVPFLLALAVAQCGRSERNGALHVLDVEDHGREMQVARLAGLVDHTNPSATLQMAQTTVRLVVRDPRWMTNHAHVKTAMVKSTVNMAASRVRRDLSTLPPESNLDTWPLAFACVDASLRGEKCVDRGRVGTSTG